MTTETGMVRTPKEITNTGRIALRELKQMITHRPEKEKLIINGKQYLFFSDWQLLGAYFGITTRIIETKEITGQEPIGDDGKFFKVTNLGYEAKAEAVQDNRVISSAVSICLREEKNWEKKDRFAILSMAETRACAKALRNCLQWVVKIPDAGQQQMNLADDLAEEQQS